MSNSRQRLGALVATAGVSVVLACEPSAGNASAGSEHELPRTQQQSPLAASDGAPADAVAAAHSGWNAESRDTAWAPTRESQLRGVALSIKESELESLECRKTVCRIVVKPANGRAMHRWAGEFQQALVANQLGENKTETAVIPDDETMRITFYITRAGHYLPAADGSARPWD